MRCPRCGAEAEYIPEHEETVWDEDRGWITIIEGGYHVCTKCDWNSLEPSEEIQHEMRAYYDLIENRTEEEAETLYDEKETSREPKP